MIHSPALAAQRARLASVLGRRKLPINGEIEPAVPPSAAGPYWLRACVVVAIVLGIFFRFYHIDRKVYWDDEVFTSLHVLGLTEAEVVARSPHIANAGEMRKLLHPGRLAPHSIGDTLHSIAVEDPHHSPLYYVIAYAWVRLFGDSIGAIRTLSAVLGVLALPCMYWMCWELFASRIAAWLGVALLALAPISVLYSQEAREYALWSIAILVMGATFIRATRIQSLLSWTFYCASLTLALYVFPFSVFLALGNLLVLLSRQHFPTNRLRWYAIVSTGVALALFSPWLTVVVEHLAQINKSMHTTIAHREPATYIARLYLSLFRLNFIDLNLLHRAALNLLLLLPVLAFLAYAIGFMIRARDRRMKVFVLAMMLFSSAPFVLPDLLISGSRTLNPRYFSPMFIALDLCLVYLFTVKLVPDPRRAPGRLIWRGLFGALLAARIISCTASSQAQTWWNKYNERSIGVAAVINAAPHPLLVTDNFIEYTLSLSNYLDDRIALELRPHCYQCSLAPAGTPAAFPQSGGVSDVFALGPSARLKADVQLALRASRIAPAYHCIDVRGNCTSPLHLW